MPALIALEPLLLRVAQISSMPARSTGQARGIAAAHSCSTQKRSVSGRHGLIRTLTLVILAHPPPPAPRVKARASQRSDRESLHSR